MENNTSNQEEMARLCLDNLDYPFFYVGLDHIIRYVNKPAIELFEKQGLWKKYPIVGSSLADHHQEAQSMVKIDMAIKKMVEEGTKEVYLYYFPDYDADFFLHGIWDDQGKLVGYYERFYSRTAGVSKWEEC